MDNNSINIKTIQHGNKRSSNTNYNNTINTNNNS